MDLNGDGHGDILSGSYSRMSQPMAGLFQVLWGQPGGTFKKAATLNGTDNEPLIIPIADKESWTENICTRPTAVDWDADGDLDLVVGNYPGGFYLFTGKGDGQFLPKPQIIMTGNSPLKISGVHSDPFVVDWDHDGDIDLLSGSSSGGVHWAENSAGPGKLPELKPFQVLIEPRIVEHGQVLSEDDLKGPAQSTRVWVDDVNSDGKLDVLIGDTVTIISPAKGLSEEEFKKEYADWQETFKVASEKARSATGDVAQRNEASKQLNDLYRKRAKFMNEERTGFVWLHLRK